VSAAKNGATGDETDFKSAGFPESATRTALAPERPSPYLPPRPHLRASHFRQKAAASGPGGQHVYAGSGERHLVQHADGSFGNWNRTFIPSWRQTSAILTGALDANLGQTAVAAGHQSLLVADQTGSTPSDARDNTSHKRVPRRYQRNRKSAAHPARVMTKMLHHQRQLTWNADRGTVQLAETAVRAGPAILLKAMNDH
jgi:hypothetical protein